MRPTRLFVAKSLLLLLTILSFTVPVWAQDDQPDEYDVKDRVVRISLIAGDVNLKRKGNTDWEPVRLNYPLVEGDTVATDPNGRVELQIDSRNFVRLGPSSVLRVATLRDEGIALSLVEGSAIVRLAKFDAEHEYFEIDAPRTTLAAEKIGLYRIDVAREGKVRLTVRDGGSARIYSDTSGFTLRDGRTAELINEGERAGDWDLLAAAEYDALDNWISDREKYRAERARYDVQYYDPSVWGAEDLDSYGDWSFTSDYGWIWRPRNASLSSYSDWAPYRYGHWVWCAPYGWTWVGDEAWGWAPYHYGRWVYYNGYWAWCPRSQFQRNRSWWRPALVAFFQFDFSFGDSYGNTYCWYPLSYYDRDPCARNYRHGDHRSWAGNYPGRDPRRNWHGVSTMPRRDWGDPNHRPRAADPTTGRRVRESDPSRIPRGEDEPRTARKAGQIRVPRVDFPDRPTGAAQRTPGVALDDELRRSRIFHGRDPRGNDSAGGNPATGRGDQLPNGAVSRPNRPGREPGDRRGDRNADRNQNNTEPTPQPQGGAIPVGSSNERQSPGELPVIPTVRPALPTTSEPLVQPRQPDPDARSKGRRERIENNTPAEPRNGPRTEPRQPPVEREQPKTEQPRSEPNSDLPRAEPKNEQPRPEPRMEPKNEQPRTEPRMEPKPERQPEARPEPRMSPKLDRPADAPVERRSEPRPETRSEQRAEPRSEPRSEPRYEQRSEPRSEPRSESPRSEPSRSESPRSETPRSESPRSEPSRSESPRSEPSRSEPSRSSESPRSESPKKPEQP